jgi:paraquat-inducible protein B
MTDPTSTPPGAADMRIDPSRRGSPSWVWLVPVIALAVALAMAWQTFADRGPLIEIRFDNAAGVLENETQLRFRDVTVGRVEDVRFSDDLRQVIVAVRIDKSVASYVDADARFWIVEPEISAQGVTGLGTLIGGVYLEGVWDQVPGTPATDFFGLDRRPLITGTQTGVEFVLRAPRGGLLSAGAPVIFKGVNVGLIDRPELLPDGSGVTARAFVRAPYDQLVTSGARFWNASGFSVAVGATGVRVNVANLSSLVQGGIAFDTILGGADPVNDGHVFDVYADRDSAGSAVPPPDEGPVLPVSAVFDGSFTGLSAGAAVEYRGLSIGTVVATSAQPAPAGAPQALLLRADMRLVPSRMGLDTDTATDDARALLGRLVAEGYRARLVSEGLLGTSLKVELAELPDAPVADLRLSEGRLLLPTAAPDITDPVNTARNALDRLERLPIERIVDEVAALLGNVNALVASQDAREAPAALVGLIDDLRGFVASPELSGAVDSAAAGLDTLDAILTRVEQGDAIGNLLAALERSDAIAAAIQATAEDLPALADRMTALAVEAAGLPLEQLTAEAAGLLAAGRAIVESDGVQAAPEALAGVLADLDAALSDLRAVAAQVRDGDAVTQLVAALERTGSIAASIDGASAELPGLLARIDTLVAQAGALPLDTLAAQAGTVLDGAGAILADPDTRALPGQAGAVLADLSGAVRDVEAITGQLAESDAVAALTSALARAESIAQSVDATAAGLPALLARIDAVAQQAETLPLADLVAASEALVRSADTLVGAPDTARLPAALTGALAEVEGTLADLRAGGVVDNTNATLASAAEAAEAVAAAADSLPELAARLDSVIAQSETLIAAYGGRSEFNAQTLATLRDLRDTARAVTSLARTIERKPNALLIGR